MCLHFLRHATLLNSSNKELRFSGLPSQDFTISNKIRSSVSKSASQSALPFFCLPVVQSVRELCERVTPAYSFDELLGVCTINFRYTALRDTVVVT